MRYGLMTSETLLEKKFFLHPISLQKLALCLMEIYQVQLKFHLTTFFRFKNMKRILNLLSFVYKITTPIVI